MISSEDPRSHKCVYLQLVFQRTEGAVKTITPLDPLAGLKLLQWQLGKRMAS